MEIIVTHTNTDFDALASLILAAKLYPEAQLVLPGSCERNVRDFLTQYPHGFNIKKSKHINLNKVTKLILVETRQPTRVGKFATLTDGKIPIHIYDHHPTQEGDVEGELMEVKEIGATVSIILEKIREQNLTISPLEATIAALGIYEDTGSLTFSTTTSSDISAVAYLISCGADLKVIARFLEKELTVDQIFILNDLFHSLQVHQIDDIEVVIAKVVIDKYVGDLSVLAHKIIDMKSLEVLFCIIGMEEKVYLIARSRTNKVDVGDILALIGGGGHKNAASATIRELSIEEVEKKLLEILHIKLATTKEVTTPPFHLFPRNIKQLMGKNLLIPIQNILKLVGEVGDRLKVNVYVVGGFVRDLLLGKATFDIDIVVEGDGIEFAKKLTEKTSGYYKSHERFKTANVVFPNGFKIDIASTRQEVYEHPAALPNVATGGIYADILRRDFTINAMAIQLNAVHYGELVDFVEGEKDLKEGFIRVLHDKSFIDDPTRIFRAIRFTSRHDFSLTLHTKELIIKSATKDLFSRLANQRIRDELVLILNDDNPAEAILQLQEFGILKYVHPSLQFGEKESLLFKKIAHTFFYFELIIGHKPLEKWLIYLLALIDKLSKEEALKFMQHLKFTKLQQKTVIKDKECSQVLTDFLKTHKRPSPADLYQHLIGVPLEVLVFIMAKVETLENEEIASQIKKQIVFFLTELVNVKVSITGEDIKKLGLKPGPIYKEVLDKVLAAKLNGKLRSKKDELKYVSEMNKKKSRDGSFSGNFL
ncbi:MAG: DHHA1 domain-containing protein [bacterium]